MSRPRFSGGQAEQQSWVQGVKIAAPRYHYRHATSGTEAARLGSFIYRGNQLQQSSLERTEY